MPLRNFYEPLTPLIEESNIVERPTVPGNTSYAGVLRKGKKYYCTWRQFDQWNKKKGIYLQC